MPESGKPASKPSSKPSRKPWYAEGLRFECQPDCGACCTNHDDYAFVYLDDDEVADLAAELQLSIPAFLERYTQLDDGWTVLRMDEPDCPFLDGYRCTVYAARPVQCRTFPFWSEALRSRKTWRRLAEFCPGIDRGKRHPLAVIKRHLTDRDGDD